jgi:restriction system protein
MTRRRNSAFEDLLTLAANLPWKVSLALAPATFIALHAIATAFSQPPAVKSTADLGAVVIRQYVHVFAAILQFVIPAAFVIGAVVSFVKRSRSISLIDNVRSAGGPAIASLAWQEFESLVGEGFRQRAFQVQERGGAGPDGGIDLILHKGHEKFLVQCKQWRAQQVGVSIVRELYGVMAAEHAAGGYVVTSGRFTKDAIEFAKGRNIELVNGSQLDSLLAKGSKGPVSATAPASPSSRTAVSPACPTCQKPMIERVAKQGRNAGKPFWGCRSYPKCRGTMAKVA